MSVRSLNKFIVLKDNKKAKKLIKEGKINLNMLDKSGLAPIHYAVCRGSFEIIDLLLLQPNIDLNILTRFGHTAMEIITLENSLPNPLRRREIITEKLIEAGCDINVIFSDGLSVLYKFLNSNDDFYSFLIKKGANINARTVDNYTPLHAIIEKGGNLNILHILLYYGADCDVKYRGIFSPFTWAIICNKYKMAKKFLYKYESDYLRNMEGITRENICEKLVEEMINNGVDFTEFLTHYSCFSRDLIINEKSFVKMWESIDKCHLLEFYDGNIVTDLFFSKFEIKYKYLIDLLSSESTSHFIIESVLSISSMEIMHYLNMRSNLSKDQIVTLIHIFLSYGMELFVSEVLLCYRKFGRNFEFLNILLYVDIHPTEMYYSLDRNDFLFQFLIHFDVDIYKEISKRKLSDNIPNLLEIFDYCTPTKAIRKLVLDQFPITDENNPDEFSNVRDRKIITEKFQEFDDVPSLLELSRDAARKFTYNSVPVKKCFFFQTAVDSFKIPDKMKQLIKFKLPIN